MGRFFIHIYTFFQGRKLLFWLSTLVVFAAVVFLGIKIRLEEDISKFLPRDPEITEINNLFSEIDITEKIIVNISLSDTSACAPDTLTSWAEAFVDSLKPLTPELVSAVKFKVDDSQIMEIWDFIYQSLPYMLEESDYRKIDSLLNYNSISETLKANKKILTSPAGMVLKKSLVKDPLHLSNIVLEKLNKLHVQDNYTLYDGCLVTTDFKNLLIFVDATHSVNATSENQALIDGLDGMIQSIEELSGHTVDIQYFGGVPVAVSNASQIKRDSYITSIIAIVLIFILLSLYFQRKSTAVYLLTPVLFGVAFSLALLFLIKTRISAIAIGAGSVVLGIAIDYSLHFLTHYRHTGSVKQTLRDISTPMIVGSLTTIGAFLSLMFVKAEALQDFGLFSALTLMGTILFVLTGLPQWAGKIRGKGEHKTVFIDKIASWHPEKNVVFLIVIVVVTIFLAFHSRNIRFDSNFSSINYISPQLTEAHKKLSQFTDIENSSVYCIAKGEDLNHALENHEDAVVAMQGMKEKNEILSYSGINNLLPSEKLQAARIKLWDSFWAEQKEKVFETLNVAGAENGFNQSAFTSFQSLINTEYKVMQVEYFQPLINTFFSDFITVTPEKALVYSLLKTNNSGDSSITNAFSDFQGIVIYDQHYLSKTLVKLLSSDFNFVLFFCGVLVFVFLTLCFGRIELSVISFIPMLISWIWILGLMSLFGIKFNIVNIIISTFIFGLGDDFSIFMTEGLMQEYTNQRKTLKSFKAAMLLAALTMIIGIGVLVFAKHPALKSLGAVTLIGMVSVVVLSYTVSPFLFRWLTMKSGKMRPTPLTFHNLSYSAFSFVAFLILSLSLNLIGHAMFAGRKNPSASRKLKYHKILQFVTGFVIKNMPGSDADVINETAENFEKPAVIIANHQSHIDLMIAMMLTPKMIVLTNQWVWNSPFYGRIIKYLDFYPVASGIEGSVDMLGEKIKEGYSILVFPEGTRSADCSIKRFHRGAFYLAEQFNVDILPLMFHGVGHRVSKEEMVLKPGKMRVTFLPRISPDDVSFGENYSKRAKGIRKMYIEKYEDIADEMFTPQYFRQHIIYSYIFKGLSSEWYARYSLKAYNFYETIITRISDNDTLLDLSCGKGVFPLLLSKVKRHKTIVAYDNNPEDILFAQTILTKPETLQFTSNSKNLTGRKFNTVTIMDRLKFLDKNQQKEIIETALDFVEEKGKIIIAEKAGHEKIDKKLARIKKDKLKSFPVDYNWLLTITKDRGYNMSRITENGLEILEICKLC